MIFEKVKSVSKLVPLEVWPLGFAVLLVAGLASYRIIKMSQDPDTLFRRKER